MVGSAGYAYYQRKIDEGKTRNEVLRCLKRRIAERLRRIMVADERRAARSQMVIAAAWQDTEVPTYLRHAVTRSRSSYVVLHRGPCRWFRCEARVGRQGMFSSQSICVVRVPPAGTSTSVSHSIVGFTMAWSV